MRLSTLPSLLPPSFFAFILIMSAISSFGADDTSFFTARRPLSVSKMSGLETLAPTNIGKYEKGYEEHDGVYVCDAGSDSSQCYGVCLHYNLNQTTAEPLVATGLSRAEDVGGVSNYDYSLYIDLQYTDGTSLYCLTDSFSVGTTDWQEGLVSIFPEKPIKSLSFYGLFRGHTGKVFFKDLALYQFSSKSQISLFDGKPVEILPDNLGTNSRIYIQDAGSNGDYLCVKPTSGQSVSIDELGISLSCKPEISSNAQDSQDFFDVSIVVTNLDKKDKALTLFYSIPFPTLQGADSWVWFDSPRQNRTISAGEYSTTRVFDEVGNKHCSTYPFGVVAARNTQGEYIGAFGLGINPDYPAFFRIASNATTRELYIAFDFSLTVEKPEAEFRLSELNWTLTQDQQGVLPVAQGIKESESSIIGQIPFGSNPFRAAFDAYRQHYPKNFEVRALKQGNWMAFASISAVKDWQDFGFQYKEGIDEISKDDALGVTTFRYTEPMTWWQHIDGADQTSPTLESASSLAHKLAEENGKNENRTLKSGVAGARVLFTTGFRDPNGKLFGLALDTPWCNGVVWSINDAPGLVGLSHAGKLRNSENKLVDPLSGFELKWNEEIANSYYPAPLDKKDLPKTRAEFLSSQSQPGCDGEYVDSSEGYVTALIDYDRAHFSGMSTPLVFNSQTKSPGIFRGLISFEYVKRISDDVHARGKLSMANSTPHSHFWNATQLDVCGTESNWHWDNAWRPMTDEELMYRRVLCCGKPYCFLMNTDFSQFSHELTEKYMRRTTAYGMFPSMFSADASTKHYFQNAELYERDRDLFKRYLPIIQKVAESGWEPETCALSNDEKIYVERFGSFSQSKISSNSRRPSERVYLTIFNDTDEEKEYEVTLGKGFQTQLTRKANVGVRELIEAKETKPVDGKLSGKIGAQDVRVFEFD